LQWKLLRNNQGRTGESSRERHSQHFWNGMLVFLY